MKGVTTFPIQKLKYNRKKILIDFRKPAGMVVATK